MENLLDFIQNRNLAENLRDLIKVTDSAGRHYRLNLIAYNTLLSNWFKGLISQEDFNIGTARIWEALFFFFDKEPKPVIKKLGELLDFAEPDGKTKILFVASAPTGAIPLQVDFEFQQIREAIERSTKSDCLELLTPLFAATLERFMIEKDKFRPAIIHFSGHGTDKSLVFSTGTNNYHVVGESILKEIFKGVGQYAKCIVLNACYAAGQAKSISEEGIWVIGMNAAIADPKAVMFSSKYYRAMSEGMSVEDAFNHARLLIQSEYPKDTKIIELWKDGQNQTPGAA